MEKENKKEQKQKWLREEFSEYIEIYPKIKKYAKNLKSDIKGSENLKERKKEISTLDEWKTKLKKKLELLKNDNTREKRFFASLADKLNKLLGDKEIKAFNDNSWFQINKKGHMVGAVELWCDDQGVAILPYVIKEGEFYYLRIFKENNPAIEVKISDYSTITGGLEDSDPMATVIKEMYEEVGIDISNCKEQIQCVGRNHANKTNSKTWWLFTVNLTSFPGINVNNTYKGKGDDTPGEGEIEGRFVTDIYDCNDLFGLAISSKLKDEVIKELIEQMGTDKGLDKSADKDIKELIEQEIKEEAGKITKKVWSEFGSSKVDIVNTSTDNYVPSSAMSSVSSGWTCTSSDLNKEVPMDCENQPSISKANVV